MSFAQQVWETLSKINVNNHTEKKASLTYLSWAWAWATLMNHYPDSEFEFKEPVVMADGTVEVWVRVCIREQEYYLAREMWLPVMDHKNNSIVKPTSRQISDARMRCLTKCLALFGLGHYIYAGEDVPGNVEPEPDPLERALAAYAKSVEAIKVGIANGDLSAAAEAWFELTDDTKAALWVAPTKDKRAPFTTKERSVMKSEEFRKSFYGTGAENDKDQGNEARIQD